MTVRVPRIVAGLLVLAGCSGTPLTPEKRAEVEALAVQVRDRAEPLEQRRKEILKHALGVVLPRPDLGPCPVSPRLVSGEDLGSFADENRTFQLSTTPISVVHAKDLAHSNGPRFYRVKIGLVNYAEGMLISTYWATDEAQVEADIDRVRDLIDPEWLAYDATLIIDELSPPRVTGPTFDSGTLRGRFYLFGYAEQAIVCAADVLAENSESLGVHKHLGDDGKFVAAKSDVDRDLFRRGVEAGIRNLVRAGPTLE